MIGAVLLAAATLDRTQVGATREAALAAALYATNWFFVFAHQPYFTTAGRSPLLLHFWSLAVEEQFYLVWPLVLLVALRVLPRRAVPLLVVAGAAASALRMAALYHAGADATRLYYGTDTRIGGLLVGAALAFAWRPWTRGAGGRLRARALDATGVAGALALVALCARLDESRPLLYEGGFALAAVASAAVIASAARPGARAGRLLGNRVLRAVGLRSYSLYLWHWPVLALTRPGLDVPLGGAADLALRVVLMAALTEVSYRCVERPARSGGIGRAWARARRAAATPGPRRAALLAGGTVAGVALAGAVALVAAARPPAPPAYLATAAQSVGDQPAAGARPQLGNTADGASIASAAPEANTPNNANPANEAKRVKDAITPTPTSAAAAELASATTALPPGPTPAAAGPLDAGGEALAAATPGGETPTATATATAAAAATATAAAREGRALASTRRSPVLAIGDSVMLGAAAELTRDLDGVEVDAVEGRQASAALADLRSRAQAGTLAPTVVLQVGDNGVFTRAQFDAIMRLLAGASRVVVVNVRVSQPWEQPNNAMLAAAVADYPNATLLDWHDASADRPDLFWKDGLHLRPEGAAVYAELIAAALQ